METEPQEAAAGGGGETDPISYDTKEVVLSPPLTLPSPRDDDDDDFFNYVSASTDDDDNDQTTTDVQQQQQHPLSSSFTGLPPAHHPLTTAAAATTIRTGGNTATNATASASGGTVSTAPSSLIARMTPSRSSKTSLLQKYNSRGTTTTTTATSSICRYTDDGNAANVESDDDDHHHHDATTTTTMNRNNDPILLLRRPLPQQQQQQEQPRRQLMELSRPSSTHNQNSHDYNNNNNNNDPRLHPTTTTTERRRSSRRQKRRRRRQKYWTVCLFSLTTVLLFADQNLMSPNLTAIANDFELDDDERDRMLGGDISLAFFLLGAPASFLVGFLADTHDRAVVFSWTVVIGELACFGTYFVRTYQQLYICRAITGFSVGGALPVIYSILGDLFAAEDRHVVSAVVSAGLGAGISVGQAVAGYLGPTFGWRLPFLVVSIPAMICASLVYCTVQDPERGGMEQAVLDQQLQQEDTQQYQQQNQSRSQYRQVDSVQDFAVCNTIMSNSYGGGFRDNPTTTTSSRSSSTLDDGTDKNDGDDDEDEDEETNYDDGQVSLVDVKRQPNRFRRFSSSRSFEEGGTPTGSSRNINNDNNSDNHEQQFDEEAQNRQVKNGTATSQRENNTSRSSTIDNDDGTMVRLFPPEDRSDGIVHQQHQEEYFDEVWTNYYYGNNGAIRGVIETICPDWRHHCRTTIKLLRTPTVVLSLIQGAPGCVPWGIINVFLNDYLSEDRGFTVEMATTTLMLFSLGYSLGLVVGGAGGRLLYRIDVRYPALLAGVTAIIGCFPLWNLLNHVDSSTPYYVSAASALVAGLGSAPTGPIIKATLTNVTLPTARGQAFAMFNLFDDFGKGLGPFFVSLLIVNLGGRLPAFNVGVFGWIICGVANLAIFFTVKRDERKIQMELSSQFHHVPSSTTIID